MFGSTPLNTYIIFMEGDVTAGASGIKVAPRDSACCPVIPLLFWNGAELRHEKKRTLSARWIAQGVKRFRGGLVSKAHRWLYHSTLGSRVIRKKEKVTYVADGRCGPSSTARSGWGGTRWASATRTRFHYAHPLFLSLSLSLPPSLPPSLTPWRLATWCRRGWEGMR